MAADQPLVGLHDLMDAVIDEIVEGIDVLLHQSPHLEEGGEEGEFVDGGLHRRR